MGSILSRGGLGDTNAHAEVTAFAKSLTNPSPKLAKVVKRVLFQVEKEQWFAAGELEDGPALVQKLAGIVSGDCENESTVLVAVSLASDLEDEDRPDAEQLAIEVNRVFEPIVQEPKRDDPGIRTNVRRRPATAESPPVIRWKSKADS